MSLPPSAQPGPLPEPPLRPGPGGAKTRSAVLIGVLIGVLVFAVGAAGFAAVTVLRNSNEDTPAAAATPTAEPPTPSPAPTRALPATDPALARYYDQKLAWKSCDGGSCTTMKVPLDYADPNGRSIGIAVFRAAATDASARLGALVVNPGGPGGSGIDFAASGAAQFGDVLTASYDIVGFDPRGVGKSDPLDCASTGQLDAMLAYDQSPDNRAERQQLDRLVATVGRGCLARSGDLARHMSTQEAARDMDILRAALGEPKLDYFGASYGTFLGATYADLFPTHVGRFVLDGAIDPALSNADLSLQQARGFETALRAYVKDCVSSGNCVLGSTVDQGTKRIKAFLDQVAANPLPTGKPRKLTEGWALLGIFFPLYAKSLWPTLTQALQQAINSGNGALLLYLADYYAARGPNAYKDNSIEALYAVNCLDHDDYIPTEQVPQHFAAFEKASPTFGRVFAFSLSSCSVWPVKSGKHTVALHAKGAPPIVVIGTTRDPATPLAWAQALAKQLDSGRLITRDGDGHTGFNQGNDCVDHAVEAWLVSGTVPKRNLMC